MSLESLLTTKLKTVCTRTYPDVAPEGAVTAPYCTYQFVGGEAITFLDRALPGLRNARVQVNVWSKTRLECNDLARQIEDVLRLAATLQAQPLGAFVSDFDDDVKLYGTRQDFSIWSP